LSSVISLEEAARRTGLTRRQIGDMVADPNNKLTIERDPITGDKGIYPHTLRGVNGYQPPEPAPPPKPPPPPPPEPEPWTPGPAELAALVKLDGHARAVAMVNLVRQHPHLRAWFRDNPLPEAFRKPPPPPPPQAKPDPPPPPPQTKPKPPPPSPPPKPPAVQVVTRKRGSLRIAVLAAGALAGLYLIGKALVPTVAPPPVRPLPVPPHVVQPATRRRAPATVPNVRHPPASALSPYLLPRLLPPGAGRQDPAKPR